MALFGRPTARDDERALAYRDWLLKRNPLAIASLVLGVFSLIEFGALLVFGIAGIVLGVAALVQLRRLGPGGRGFDLVPGSDAAPEEGPAESNAPAPRTHGHRLAWAGIALSAASLVIAGLLYARVFG